MAKTPVTHTPGPWEADQTVADTWIIGPDQQVRTVRGTVARVQHASHMRLRAETVANARLIAAAPELLDALRSALPLAEKGYAWWQNRYEANPSDEASGHLDGLLATIEAVRAAIAKAEGR